MIQKPLSVLEPEFVVRTEKGYRRCSFAEAEGLWLLCPECWDRNNGPVGTHGVLCWRPCVPLSVTPGPGRWEFKGTGMDDLTLVAGSSSVLLQGGCNAHFYVQGGQVKPA